MVWVLLLLLAISTRLAQGADPEFERLPPIDAPEEFVVAGYDEPLAPPVEPTVRQVKLEEQPLVPPLPSEGSTAAPSDVVPSDVAPSELPVPAPAPMVVQTSDAGTVFPSHVIRIGDEIEIVFPYRPDFNQRITVREDGLINPTLLEPVVAAGQLPEALREELITRYQQMDYAASLHRSGRGVYLLQAGDEIEVRFEIDSKMSDRVTLRPDGRISLPNVGDVVAEGKTVEQLRQELMVAYRPILQRPELTVVLRKATRDMIVVDGKPTPLGIKGIDELTVRITHQAPRVVYVTGEVGNSAAVPYRPGLTLRQALITAGGVKRTGEVRHVVILRRMSNACQNEITVNLRPCARPRAAVIWQDSGYFDVSVMPDDVIIVPQTKIAKIQDFLDQYVYNLVPPLRNSSFVFFYNLVGNNTPVGAPAVVP